MWLPLGVVALVPLLLLRLSASGISDPDTFWHIRAGHFLLDTWQFNGPDPFSRFSENRWVLHEWLPEIAAAWADDVAGLAGVTWLWHLGVVGVFVALFLTCRRHGGLLPTLVASLAGLYGASGSLSARPQLVTFALVAVTTGAWLLTSGDLKQRWWLVPMSWLWAGSHGMWFVGPLIGFAVMSAMLLDGADRRRTLKLAVVPVLSVLVAALTPVGPALLLAPLAVGDYTKYVSEWAPVSLTSPFLAVTVAMLGVTVLLWSRGGRRIEWSRLAILAMSLGWCLLYGRTIAVGAMMAAPLLVEALHRLVTGSGLPIPHVERRTERRWLTASVVTASVLAAGVLPATASRPSNVPNELNARLDSLPDREVVFNDYALGGWLLWRHPELAPVIDGRTEVFTVPYVDRYMNALTVKPGWQEVVATSGATSALLRDDSPLGDALQHQLQWTVVGSDGGYTLLRSPGGSS